MRRYLSLAMRRYSIEPKTRKQLKDMDSYHLQENIKKICWI